MYLITANFADPQRNQFIKDLADQFCSKFGVLQERGHAKWKTLSWQPGSSLPGGRWVAVFRQGQGATGQLPHQRGGGYDSETQRLQPSGPRDGPMPLIGSGC